MPSEVTARLVGLEWTDGDGDINGNGNCNGMLNAGYELGAARASCSPERWRG